MIFFTSDLHISHANIIKFCNRPFDSVEEMNRFIIDSWNKSIKPEDEVYFLGDFSFTISKRGARYFLHKLNGKKYFIKGNHDRTQYLNNFKNSGLIEWWKYDHSFSYDYNGKTYNFSLSHYPHYPSNSDIICVFGHIHGRRIETDGREIGIDVGVDNIGYEPISIETLMNYYYTEDVVSTAQARCNHPL